MQIPIINTQKPGFALVIALGLMSFVLLFMLTLIGYCFNETENSTKHRNHLLAKQNALTAMHLAISELQLRLGPDQRATANADVLAATNTPYTLVWNADPNKGWNHRENDWTRTGGEMNFAYPLLSLQRERIHRILAGGDFNEDLLDAPVGLLQVIHPAIGGTQVLQGNRIPIRNNEDMVTGSYAWVAQDQSLKAPLSLKNANYTATDEARREIGIHHDMALAETSRRLSVFPHSDPTAVNFDDLSLYEHLNMLNEIHISDLNKCIFIGDIQNAEFFLSIAEDDYKNSNHQAFNESAFTIQSKGVLCDTQNGGLKRDLSRGLDDEYFVNLHNRPVFGVDPNGILLPEAGIVHPVGDQWKFFRDFYNFYRPVDDGLTADIDARNVFFGLSDVAIPNPSTPMRYTNKDVSKYVNFLYTRHSHINDLDTPTYSTAITPELVRRIPTTPALETDLNAWYLFTPSLRPVILRKSIKIGLQSRPDSTPGKYRLQFKLYPSMVLWNPYNVSINLNPPASANPLIQGRALNTKINGNDRIVLEINEREKYYELNTASFARELVALHHELLTDSGLPIEMPPGQVWVLGLHDNYTADLKPISAGNFYPPGVDTKEEIDAFNARGGVKIEGFAQSSRILNMSRSGGNLLYGNKIPLFIANADSNVSEDNAITYNCDQLISEEINLVYGLDSNDEVKSKNVAIWEEVLLDEGDVITIKMSTFNNPNTNNNGNRIELDWTGVIAGNPQDNRVEAFHHYENSDLINTDEDVNLGEVSMLANGDQFPFYQIDFRARTLNNEIVGEGGLNNPAFPAFSSLNFLGAQPLPVTENLDSRGDIRATYIPERVSLNIAFDALPQRDEATGSGYFGGEFGPGASSSSKITLYDLPRHPIISIADFKNLAFGWFEDGPGRPIGASWPNPTLRNLGDTYVRIRGSDFPTGAGCDTSYHYNNTLFDRYFFSGIPSANRNADPLIRAQTHPYGQEFNQEYIDNDEPLANTRLQFYGDPNLSDFTPEDGAARFGGNGGFETSAGHLLIDGPFNINSTNPAAWQAVLSGFRNQTINGVNSAYTAKQAYGGDGSPFVDNFIPSEDNDDIFAGYRRLSDDDLRRLSQEITANIRERGTALHLGQFVNRDPESDLIVQQKMSVLDEAIEETNLAVQGDLRTRTTEDQPSLRVRPELQAAQAQLEVANLVEETRAGLPGYFKQQDILRPLAPIMTTRGDTFVIRAYGESIHPISGEQEARALCEVIIQRVPDYVDDTIESWEIPELGTINEKFGRKFKVIQFRWLAPDEIT